MVHTHFMDREFHERLTEIHEQIAETLVALRERLGGRDCTAYVDDRGRLTIKEDDRKALGIEGDRALLDLHVKVLEKDVDRKRADGGERDD